jgi:hypothetical protein
MPNFSHGTAGIAFPRRMRATKDRRYLEERARRRAVSSGDCQDRGQHLPDRTISRTASICSIWAGAAPSARTALVQPVEGDRREIVDGLGVQVRARVTAAGFRKHTPGFWNNVSQCCGSAGVAQFFLDLHGLKPNATYAKFAKKMTDDLLARGTRDEQGLRWVQAEHRVRPELLLAQTGYMQGASGIGMWLLRLDATEQKRQSFVKFPDSPW